jgi:hypothetical protein
LVVLNGNSITKLDGISGQVHSSYTVTGAGGPVAVHTDGTIFTVKANYTAAVAVIGIDLGGARKFSVPLAVQPYLDPFDIHDCRNGGTFSGRVDVSSIIVAGDGYAYVGFGYPELNVACGQVPSFISHLRLLRINSAGAHDIISIQDVPALGCCLPSIEVIAIDTITNADTGVLLSWSARWEGDVDTSSVCGPFNQIADGLEAPSYSDHNIESGKHYRYRVVALDQAGNASEPCDPVDVTAP